MVISKLDVMHPNQTCTLSGGERHPPHEMTQTKEEEMPVGRGDQRSPWMSPKTNGMDANTPGSKKADSSEGTGP